MRTPGVFLPSVHFEENAWRLPLHPTSVPIIGMALTAERDGTPSDLLSTSIRHALTNDSALLLFTTLQHCQRDTSRPKPQTVSLTSLVEWWCRRGRDAFLSESVVASNPVGGSCTVDKRSADRLWAYFQTRPLHSRLANAGLWLAAVGREPPSGLHEFLRGVSILTGAGHSQDEQQTDPIAAESVFLQRIAEQAETSDRLHQRFESEQHACRRELARNLAYGMSHEVNNPLTSIVTRAEGLLANSSQEAYASSLKRIVDQAYRAYGMIADLMFVGNPPSAEFSRVACRDIVARSLESVSEQARDQHTDIQVDVADLSVDGDGSMLADALTALLKNSLQAIGEGGRIQITATHEGESLALRVADSGPGVTPEQRDKAFDPFFSGREAGRGLGMGLARVNAIAQMHGGDVEMCSAVAGCVVEIRIPVQRV